MEKTKLPEYSVYIITEYYKNNIRPFLNSFSEKCICIGPAEKQMIHSRKALVAALARENGPAGCSIQDIRSIPIPVDRTSMDVILTYTVATRRPDGKTLLFQQRAELLWAEECKRDGTGQEERDYLIRVCHISNAYPCSAQNTISPDYPPGMDMAKLYPGRARRHKYALKGLYNSFFYLSNNAIMWMSSKYGNTIIHTADRTYESTESLSTVVEKYPNLCRIHNSHAINPMYLSEIGRFYARMDDGTKLPIPEKKYTKTREEINRRIHELTSDHSSTAQPSV